MNRRRLLLYLCAAPVLGAAGVPYSVLSGGEFARGDEGWRLVDIIAPIEGAPYAEKSAAALAALLREPFDFEETGAQDRWLRRIGRARAGKTTFQERLIAAGAARVRPESEDDAFIRRLLLLEDEARQARRGLWRLDAYAVRGAANAQNAIDAFHLVEGEILKTAKFGARVYLNFGEDYREDFTVTAPSRLATRWAKQDGAPLDLLALAGARVRARGFVAPINGPSIELSHPLQLEFLAA